MSEIQNAGAICPVCGKENKAEGNFCQFCGGSMGISDFQPFEISQTMSFRKYCFSSCCIIFIGFLFYFSLVIAPSVWGGFEAAVIAALFLVLLGGVSIGGLFYILWAYRGSGVRRFFSILPSGIKIVVPRKPVFEVNWSEFDLIQVYKHAGSNNSTDYRLYFVLNDEVRKEFNIEGSMHFSGLNCRTIVSKLQEYAIKMNKQFAKGRRKRKKY
jgi:hypothetical protein